MPPETCGYCTHPIETFMPWDTHRGMKVHDECHTAIHGGDYAARVNCIPPAKNRTRRGK